MKPLGSNRQNSAFGLVAWLEKTRVALPLKGVECRFHVTDAIACVEVDQIYHQNSSRPLDCTYTFPLPAGAAVYRCELHVNDRVIRAMVEEKGKAQQIYREQKAAGRRAALVETERENLFTLSLGNVQPGDLIVVRFAWFQVLDRIGGALRLMVPTCPGVRYIPGRPLLRGMSGRGTADDTDQVPDASRITPPRIDSLHPDAAYFAIEGRLSSADVESGTITSPSHAVCVREAEGQMSVALFGNGAVPDRDFVLVWQEPKAKQLVPQAWRWTEAGETYALVQLRAPEGVNVADGFSQDFYFLVDRSGSMAGAKWDRTCEALSAFVGLLGPEDRVAITLFESDFRDFAEAPLPAPKVRNDRGFQRMVSLGTAGGTELLPAVRHVLERIAVHSQGRRTTVVLITDGQIGNEPEVISAFKGTPTLTVHTFGIDRAVNDAFLKALAGAQRGGCWLQTPDDEIAGTIAALGDRLRRPVLTDLSIRGAWETGRPSLPDLHAREVVTVALRGKEACPIEITGLLPDGRRHSFTVDLGNTGNEAIKLLWAKERIAALLAAERRQEAIACAKLHNLICEGTAFIAWDEVEKVQVAEDEIVQPAMETPIRSTVACCGGAVDLMDAHDYSVGIRAQNEDLDLIARRIAKLREMLQQTGMSQTRADEFIEWAKEDEAFGRVDTIEKAAGAIRDLAREVGRWVSRERLDQIIQQAVGSSPAVLIAWEKEMRRPIECLLYSIHKLGHAGAPEAVLAHVIDWVCEAGTLNRERIERVEEFASSLKCLPFSAASRVRHWQAFLDSTTHDAAPHWLAAQAWITELGGVGAVIE
jgi:Ca-activated chloride channel family protein